MATFRTCCRNMAIRIFFPRKSGQLGHLFLFFFHKNRFYVSKKYFLALKNVKILQKNEHWIPLEPVIIF